MSSRTKLAPVVPAVASLVLPGLGQLITGHIRRGLLMLASMATIVAMAGWRFRLIARLEMAPWDTFVRAVERRPFFVLLVVCAALVTWAAIVWDAYARARARGRELAPASHVTIFLLIIVVFFALGWEISRIDVVKMVREFPEAWPPLSRVLWPWEAAVTRETREVKAGAPILSPCGDPSQTPPPPEEVPGEPYVRAEPRCGDLSVFDASNNVVAGTLMTVTGRGFAPNTETQIWWVDPIGNDFQMRQSGRYVTVTTDDEGAFQVELNMPYRLLPPSAEGLQIHRVEARQISEVGGLQPAEPLLLTISRMIETIFMGMMATLFGIVLSIPVSFLAARNLMSGTPLTMAVYYLTRTVLNIVRSIEPLIWALVAVVWVGLGPFAGIVALTVHSVAALGKLYSEAIEGIEPGPIEAIQATGANKLQTIVYAVIPQMIPPFVSFSIYRWDINVRMSTVIGLVGGGGVGFLLVQYIRLLDYRAAGIAVWFIAITVATLDYVSAEIRQRFM
jgi:phosphonate transport system permease protein